MIILEGRNDMYMPVKLLREDSGEAKIYLCENQKGQKFVSRIYPDLRGMESEIRHYLFQCDNPYVMPLLDFGVTEFKGSKCAFEILPYMTGGTWAEAAPVAADVVEKEILPCLNEGLHRMHEAGLLHRDVKPDNIYIVRDEAGNRGALLGDFGISVHMKSGNCYCDTALAYTPGYVPAEVLSGSMYSPASDYYALGVSVYYLLTGHQIFAGMTPDEIMLKTRRGELLTYEGVEKRFANLLEGLMVQDPRYRWGYTEVKQWLQGASVPVFRHTQEVQLLEPPYQLTTALYCHSLRELAENLSVQSEEGIRHLYEGLISDGVRRQYPYLYNGLNDLIVNRFPYARHAGLCAAMKLIDPKVRGFFWYGTNYNGLNELLTEVRNELAAGETSAATEELMTSGILSYYYGDMLSDEDKDILKLVENIAARHPQRAQALLVLHLLPTPVYQIGGDVFLGNMKEYVDYLEQNRHAVRSLIEQDFNKPYFHTFIDVCGHRETFNGWIKYFYNGGKVLSDDHLMGNVCQFLGEICPDQLPVLKTFVMDEIKNSPEYWMKDHLALYEMDEMMTRMVHENFDHIALTQDMSLQELLQEQHRMKECMQELRRDLMNNYAMMEQGVYDVSEYRITTRDLDGLFVPRRNGTLVPVGWLRESQGIIGRNEIQAGLASMRAEADLYLDKVAGQAKQWSEECDNICKEKKAARKSPGLFGGILALLLPCILIFELAGITRTLTKVDNPVTWAGMVAVFLVSVFWMIAGLRRMVKVLMWKRLERSGRNLADISAEILARKGTYSVEDMQTLPQSADNLETEVQVERATGCSLLSDYRMKNGLLRYWLLAFLAVGILIAGMAMDGTLSHSGLILPESIGNLLGSNEAEHNVAETQSSIYTVKSSKARLRSGPGTDYEVLNSYDKGTEMTPTGKSQSDGKYTWYEVVAPDDTTGWMRGDTLKRK